MGNQILYKPYYWWIGIILILLISLPALFLGGVISYLITLIFVGVPLVLLGIGGLKQEQNNYDNFSSTVREVLENGSYKGRTVNIRVDSYLYQYGKKVSPPIVEMSLYGIQNIPIKTILYYYFFKGVGIYNNRLNITCYRYVRKRVGKDLVIKLLDKLSSIADILEAKYHT